MAVIDIEDVLVEIKNKIIHSTAGLNAIITAINSERAASDVTNYGGAVTLNSLVTGSTFLLVASSSCINFDPYITITIEGYEADEMGGLFVSIGINIVLLDNADGFVDIRSIRYITAIKRLFETERFIGGLEFSKVSLIEPTGFEDSANNKSWRNVGIKLSVYFA